MDPNVIAYTCRGCLAVETNAVLHSLENDKIRELFTNCTAVQINLDETNTPLQICSLCFGRCENWESFRNRCQLNDEEVRKTCGYSWESEEGNDEEKKLKEMDVDFLIEHAEVAAEEEEQEQEEEEEVGHEEDEEYAEEYNQDDVETQEEYEAREFSSKEEEDKPRKKQYLNGDSQAAYICEVCGETVRGLLNYRKHKFQKHTVNIKKRFKHCEKIIEEVTNIMGPQPVVIGDQEQILVQSWTQKSRKKMRNSGEAYINNGAVLVDKKRVQPIDCSSCNLKCNENFTEETREELHKEYWAKDFGGKRLFLHQNVMEKKCGRMMDNSRRQYTLVYSFLGQRVCKKFFIGTLDITDRIIMHSKLKARQNVDVTFDYRGTRGGRKGRGKIKGNAESTQ